VLWDENGWMEATTKTTMNYSNSHGINFSTSTTNYGAKERGIGNGILSMQQQQQQRHHRTLYTHPIKHAGVWSIHPYVTDGQSALASACADGMKT
jgi:hypothetical protein